ncbi:MAG: ACP phosphodiesterase [Cytophagaceae bacterium]|jgi:acyl carrier protein phosphodiesterase|nr:ACP phosphodiesterase [Cytophagaceae bacterium]
MNFLAHLYLSFETSDFMVGNFIADSIRGKEMELYSITMQKGIRYHRFIDHYTDNHPVTHEIKDRIQHDFHKYNAVVVDIYYDHFLAKHWTLYHTEALTTFAQNFYSYIQTHSALPERVKELLPYMIKQDWLVHYAEIEGLQRIFNGMAKRANFPSNMEAGTEVLRREYTFLEEKFFEYFPDLVTACKNKLADI